MPLQLINMQIRLQQRNSLLQEGNEAKDGTEVTETQKISFLTRPARYRHTMSHLPQCFGSYLAMPFVSISLPWLDTDDFLGYVGLPEGEPFVTRSRLEELCATFHRLFRLSPHSPTLKNYQHHSCYLRNLRACTNQGCLAPKNEFAATY